MQTTNACSAVPSDLITRIRAAAARHAEAAADLIVLLAHAKAVNAAEAHGYPSLFAFCKDELLLSRDQAYRYLACANVYMVHPQILPALKSGRLTATGVAVLASYVKASTVAHGAAALARAEGLTVDAIEKLAVELTPKPDVPCIVKPVASKPAAPQPLAFALSSPRVAHRNPGSLSDAKGELAPGGASAAGDCTPLPSPPARTVPLSPASYKLTMTLSAAAYEQLNELRDLSSHAIPHGELDKVLTRAIEVALAHARKAKQKVLEVRAAKADRELVQAIETRESGVSGEAGGRSSSSEASAEDADGALAGAGRRVDQTDVGGGERYIPAAVRRAVWRRDEGRCAFVGSNGRRCGSTWQLEIDHIVRVADGGTSTEANTRLCCRRHNQAREAARGRNVGALGG